MARRVKTTRTILVDGKEQLVARDVWPLPFPMHGYVFNRKGVATLRYDDVYRSLGLEFKAGNRRRALAEAARLVEAIRASRRGLSTPTLARARTVYEAWREFFGAKVAALTPYKQREFNRALERWCPTDAALTDDELYRVTAEGLQRVAAAVAPGTFPAMLRPWREFVTYCRARGWVSIDPLGLVTLPKAPAKAAVVVYSARDLQRIDDYFAKLDVAPAPLLRLLWKFLTVTGARIHEALALRWDEVTATEIRFTVTKGSRPRPFPLSPFPELRGVLADLRKHTHDRPGYVFPWERSQTSGEYLREALNELGIEGGVQPQHTFRKTAIRLWRDAGIPYEVRLRLAGHNLQTAATHYDAAAAADELVRAIEAAGKTGKTTGKTGKTTAKTAAKKIGKKQR